MEASFLPDMFSCLLMTQEMWKDRLHLQHVIYRSQRAGSETIKPYAGS